jgi:hypothetical protein
MRFILFSLVCLSSCTRTPDITEPKIQIGEAPIADAGSAATVTSDQPIFLDGASSYDPDGQEITYHWSFGRIPEGSMLDETGFSVNASIEPSTSFLADTAGTYIIELVVIDETELESNPDSVIITVTEGQLPTANAGADVEIMQGESITLSGEGSADPLGRSLEYLWGIADKPATSVLETVDSPAAMQTTFTPDAAGIYLLTLTVNNGINDSAPDVVVVRVTSSNPIAPTALAGDDMLDTEDCSAIQLNGSGSFDPNGDALEYLWTLQSKPTDSLASNSSFSDINGEQPTFYADIIGEYIISLSVNDGTDWSSPDLITITTIERVSNAAPTVNAGNSLSVDAGDGMCELSGYSYNCSECDPVTLTIGTGGSVVDPDGDPVSYEWQVVSGDVTISDPTTLETTATFEGATPTDINVCENNSYELELVAVDCPGASSIDSVTVTLSCCGLEETTSN